MDKEALCALCEMGFPENRASKALVLNQMNVEQAMEWLFRHGDDPDIDEPLKVGIHRCYSKVNVPKLCVNTSWTFHVILWPNIAPLETLLLLWSILQAPKPQETARGLFTPDMVAYRGLLDMGFAEKDVVAALQLAHNNFRVACDWLVSGRDVHSALDQQEANFLDENSPLIRAILSDPHVQAYLVDIRIRKALEILTQQQHNAIALMNDPIITHVTLFLSQLINRFT